MQPETLNRSIQPTPTVHPRGFTPKSRVILIAVLAAFGLSGFAAVVFSRTAPSPDNRPTSVRSLPQPSGDPAATGPVNSAEWLASMRPYCNPVDVEMRLAWSPAP